jgi:hypothetical protein
MRHGRAEKRECDVFSELRFLDDRPHWPGLQRIVRIRSERAEKKTGKITRKTHYYISSLGGDAAQFNAKIGQHWAIENNLHWSLYVLFNEDALSMKWETQLLTSRSSTKWHWLYWTKKNPPKCRNNQNG